MGKPTAVLLNKLFDIALFEFQDMSGKKT